MLLGRARIHKSRRELTAHHGRNQGRTALIGHMRQVQARLQIEQSPLQMGRGARAIRANAVLAGVGLDQAGELGEVIDGQCGRCGQHTGADGHTANRRKVLDRVIRQLHQGHLLHQRHDAKQHRVAIGRGLGHQIVANGAACAGLVFDHHSLLPAVLHFLCDHAGQHIGGPASGVGHDELDGLARVGGLRWRTRCPQQGQAAQCGQGHAACDGLFHVLSPWVVVVNA